MKDVSGVSGGEGQGEEEEDGQWDSQEGVNNAWRCTVHTHTFDGSARRDASPPFVWSPGRQHHLARSSLPRKRVSLRRAQLFDTAAKQWSVSRGRVSTLPLSKTHLRHPNSDSRRVHQSRRSFREQLQLLKHQLIHSCSGSPPPNKASAPLRFTRNLYHCENNRRTGHISHLQHVSDTTRWLLVLTLYKTKVSLDTEKVPHALSS